MDLHLLRGLFIIVYDCKIVLYYAEKDPVTIENVPPRLIYAAGKEIHLLLVNFYCIPYKELSEEKFSQRKPNCNILCCPEFVNPHLFARQVMRQVALPTPDSCEVIFYGPSGSCFEVSCLFRF